MYSNTIEQELYGERWDAFKGKLKKSFGGTIFNSDPFEKGVSDGKKAGKKTKKFFSNLFKSEEQKAKEKKERNDNAIRNQRAKNRNYIDDLDKMKSERDAHMSIIKKKRSGQKLTPAEEKKYQAMRRRINERKKVRERSLNKPTPRIDEEANKYQEQVLRKSNAEKDRKLIASRKSAFRDSEAKRLRNYKIGGSVAGAGVGGALGYALSKRATRNTEPGKKRTAIRIGSTIAGAAIGGVGGHYAGKKLAVRGAKLRYRNFQR